MNTPGPERAGYNTGVLHRPFFAAALILATALAAQAATNFQDIPPGHWARRAANVLADHQVVPGRGPVDFAGGNPLSRYELAWTLSHLYNIEGPPASFVVLGDMPPGHTATLEVQRVMGYDLMPARKPGRFEGDAPASRKEVVESLDALFAKDGVAPPSRKTAVTYDDVKAGTPLAGAIDRIVNRFALIEAKEGGDFHPADSLTRYQFLSMIMRAMRYLRPNIAKELETPESPTPASLEPGQSPIPGVSPTPTPMPSGQVLRTKAWGRGEVLALYTEDIPTDPGLFVTSEQRNFTGMGLPGGGAGFEFWSGAWGGTLDVSSYYLGIDIANQGKKVAVDLVDTTAHLGLLYQIPLSPEAQLGFGAAGQFRQTYNITGNLVSQLYATADKTYIGAGPAVMLGYRVTPALALSTTLDAYPVVQTYNLPATNGQSGAKSVTRFALYPRLTAEYGLGNGLMVTGGLTGMFNSGGGGTQSQVGATLGFGGQF
ncbi:MAG: putative S-layer protein [Cyanobacteria bacterium RYN_339]|nr:putative S-layer protein [Cyanobacteria bacterium RYN_339]